MIGNSVRRPILVVFTLALLGSIIGPRPAAAIHIKGIAITVTSVDGIAGSVDIDVTESSGSPFGSFYGPYIAWGDAVSAHPPWTSNFTNTASPGLNFHKISASHVYPDLTTRTISVASDCCGPGYISPLFDTVVIDFNCADTPMAGCRLAGKAKFQMQNNANDAKDKLKFKWNKGAETLLAALGDPVTSAQYYLCVYAPAPAQVLEATIPAGALNWKAAGTKAFKYKDKAGTAGGVTKIKLKSGPDGKATVQVIGKGADLDDPLPLTQPVTVQVQNNLGECWEHAFTAPEIKNSAEKFLDKEP